MPKLLHYASKRILIRRRKYPQRVSFKPEGFWVSVGNEWGHWTRQNQFHVNEYRFVHHITFPSTLRVLKVRGVEAFDAFNARYGKTFFEMHNVPDPDKNQFPYLSQFRYYAIDWPTVAVQYDGIVIHPYLGSRRHGPPWYYGWDIASGCIWNLKGVRTKLLTS